MTRVDPGLGAFACFKSLNPNVLTSELVEIANLKLLSSHRTLPNYKLELK